MNDVIDPDLERRLVAALHEQIPRLCPIADEAVTSPRLDEVVPIRRSGPGAGRPPRRVRVLGVAAAFGAVAGLGTLLVVAPGRDGSSGPATDAAPAPTAAPTPVPVAGSTGPALTTALPADATPRPGIDGWTYYGYAGVQPISTDPPTPACPGCGADRLVVAADGDLFAGALLTAWVIDGADNPADFDRPVTINGRQAMFTGAQGGDASAAQSKVVVMLPLDDGRTGYVEAAGLANDDVFALAAAIDFAGPKPSLTPPAGFHVIDSPRRAGGQWTMVQIETPDRTQSMEVYATNLGVQGLTDWRYAITNTVLRGWTPRVIDGVTTAFDFPGEPEQQGLGIGTAAWVAGDWGFVVHGVHFADADQFAATIAALRLTDEATFAAGTADAPRTSMSTAEEEAAKAADAGA